MLLFRRQKIVGNKNFFNTFILLISCLLLSSCSYRPLYDQRTNSDNNIIKNLELIEIEPIKDRIGQSLHNNLLVHLNPRGKPEYPIYKLSVTLQETRSNLGVKKSAVVTRGNLKILATFVLSKAVNISEGTKADSLFTSKVTAISSYDIPQAQYAALAALKNARVRALRKIADNIKTRLGIYFSQGSN